MARRKDHSPLFEIIRGGQDGASRPRIELPPWLANSGGQQQAESKDGAGQPRSRAAGKGDAAKTASDGAGRGPVSVSASGASAGLKGGSRPVGVGAANATAQGGRAQGAAVRVHRAPERGLRGWLGAPVDLTVTRLRVIVAGSVALVVMMGVYLVGHGAGQSAAETALADSAYARSAGQMATLRERDVVPGLADRRAPAAPPDRGRVGADGAGSGAAIAGIGSRQATPALVRQPGLNYFRLMTVPGSGRPDAESAVAFLREHGVDAAVVPAKNDPRDKLAVVAFPGFARPLSDPNAKAFENRLRSLGRQWKQRERGPSDWRDLFPEKYDGP